MREFLNLLAGNRLEDAEQTETGVVDQGVNPAEPSRLQTIFPSSTETEIHFV
jgi:hypothetical protein